MNLLLLVLPDQTNASVNNILYILLKVLNAVRYSVSCVHTCIFHVEHISNILCSDWTAIF